MIKLLAVDMDGTCLNRKNRISDETMKALEDAAKAGILIVPTTGRTTTCLPMQLKGANFWRYIISSNGADVLDARTNKTIYHALIPHAQTAQILEECGKNGIGLSIHLEHQFIVQGVWLNLLGRITYGRDAKNTQYERNIVQRLRRQGKDVEEIQLFFLSKRKKELVEKVLEQHKNLSAAYSSNYVEIYEEKASKGNALKALAQYLQIAPEEIACIGDAENDLSMFAASGLKMAMGNAIPKLKQKADAVLPTNEESGVACGIRQYLLAR